MGLGLADYAENTYASSYCTLQIYDLGLFRLQKGFILLDSEAVAIALDVVIMVQT